jgi:hypothetical protein
VVEVGYFGSKGTHLLGAVDLNSVRPGVALAAGLHQPNGNTVFTATDWPNINAVRPYKGFNAFTAIESAFDSNYHSLQANLRKSFGWAGLIGVSYTFSKTLTDNGSDRSNAPQDAYNWHDGEYGPAPTDRRQVLTANYVYTLPFLNHGRGLLNSAVGGWQVSGIVAAYTGQPTTITTSGVDPAGLGIGNGGPASLRPDQICDPNQGAPHTYGGSAQSASQGLAWFNTACFAAVPQGVVRPGNAGRYTVRGPGFFNLDTSIMKNFNISKEGQWKLQLRAETFNTLNWVNPSGFASANNTSTVFGENVPYRAARRIQLRRQDQLLAPSFQKHKAGSRQREPAFFIPGRNARDLKQHRRHISVVAPPPCAACQVSRPCPASSRFRSASSRRSFSSGRRSHRRNLRRTTPSPGRRSPSCSRSRASPLRWPSSSSVHSGLTAAAPYRRASRRSYLQSLRRWFCSC